MAWPPCSQRVIPSLEQGARARAHLRPVEVLDWMPATFMKTNDGIVEMGFGNPWSGVTSYLASSSLPA